MSVNYYNVFVNRGHQFKRLGVWTSAVQAEHKRRRWLSQSQNGLPLTESDVRDAGKSYVVKEPYEVERKIVDAIQRFKRQYSRES